MKRTWAWVLSLVLLLGLLSGCGKQEPEESSAGGENSGTPTGSTVEEPSFSEDELFSDRDYEVGYDEENSVFIQLMGDKAQADSASVQIDGSRVILTQAGTYVLSGTLEDGSIVVSAPDSAKVQLVLDNVNITSKTSAALYVLSGDKVFVTLADDSENSLANGGEFVAIDENNIDGAVFSKEDLTLNGEGSLTVISPAGHGIVCKDDLVLTSGEYHISSASHGMDVNDSVRIANGVISAETGKDGIHAENDDDDSLGFVYISGGTLKIQAEGDGISAGAYLEITGGVFDITAGGGSENGSKASSGFYGQMTGGGRPGFPGAGAVETDNAVSMKGLRAAGGIWIADAQITVNSADDAIHSNLLVNVKSDSLELATGDDGIHADEELVVSGGTIHITESYEGLEALQLVISGGDIRVKASDDGLNAAAGRDASGAGGRDGLFGGGGGMSASTGSILISGGSLYINASGDGLDANGSLSITGGSLQVFGPNSGDTTILDFDSSGTISGGTFIGAGAVGMAQNFSTSSAQGVIMMSVGTQAAGTEICLKDSQGKVLLSATPDYAFSCVIFSCEEIQKGGEYTISAGSFSQSVTMTASVYGDNGSGGPGGGGFGGGPGGFGGGPGGGKGGR